MKLEALLTQLDGVSRTATGSLARCPAHDDRRASLSVGEGADGKLLLKCFAGCETEQVVQALGLTMKDLFADSGGPDPEPRIVKTYDYRDETGTLLYQVVRRDPKDFRPRRPDGQGGWVWNLDGIRRIPYRLSDLAKAKPRVLYIVEGEKDVDRLWSLGLQATCNPGGAKKWREEYADCLVKLLGSVKVVILADNDDPGRKHAVQVARSFWSKTEAIKVLLALPSVPDKGDISDYLAMRSKGALIELVKTTPALTLEELERLEGTQKQENRDAARGLPLTRLGDLLAEPEEAVSWLVEERLPSGGLSIMAAKPKVGKSTLARCLALAVAQGTDWLRCKTTQGTVFYLALEEKRAEVRKHFAAMGATADDPVKFFIAPSPTDGLQQLRAAAEQEKPGLIIIDPIVKFTRVKDLNDYAQVTTALEPLLTLARETGAHVLTVHHLGKGERAGGDAILGSTALFAAVDTALLLKRSDRYRTLTSIQRYGEDLEEITLTLDPVSKTISAGPSRKEADQSETMQAILDFLKNHDDPVEREVIEEAVEGRTSVKRQALKALVERKTVTRSGKGTKGDPFKFLILVPTYIGEQENKNPKNGVSSDEHSKDSCSAGNPVSDDAAKSWEQESEAQEAGVWEVL